MSSVITKGNKWVLRIDTSLDEGSSLKVHSRQAFQLSKRCLFFAVSDETIVKSNTFVLEGLGHGVWV